jgi:hypothetical protein
VLGDDFLAYLTLAIGGALVVGNVLALLRPQDGAEGDVVKAPLGRSMIQITIGGIASIWALATIIT